MTGLEAFDAVKRIAHNLPCWTEIRLGIFDSYDLGKLTTGDLIARDYQPFLADFIE